MLRSLARCLFSAVVPFYSPLYSISLISAMVFVSLDSAMVSDCPISGVFFEMVSPSHLWRGIYRVLYLIADAVSVSLISAVVPVVFSLLSPT